MQPITNEALVMTLLPLTSATARRCSLTLGLTALVAIALFVNRRPLPILVPQHHSYAHELTESSSLHSLLSQNTDAIEVSDLPTASFQPVLNADELIDKQFRNRLISFQLFIAHWRAGNQYASEASQHPPELCWPDNGWSCNKVMSMAGFHSGTALLPPGEWRRFSTPTGASQEVLFWCILDGSIIPLGYRPRATPWPVFLGSHFLGYWRARLHDDSVSKNDLVGPQIASPTRADVYFIRVNSTFPADPKGSNPNVCDRVDHAIPSAARIPPARSDDRP